MPLRPDAAPSPLLLQLKGALTRASLQTSPQRSGGSSIVEPEESGRAPAPGEAAKHQIVDMLHLRRVQQHKPRLLALHGKGSNAFITRLQLRNLFGSWLEEMFHLFCIEADHVTEPLGELEKLSAGPFFSWVAPQAERTADAEADVLMPQASVDHLEGEIRRLGPFVGAFGFSQGAVLLTRLLQQHTRETAPFHFVILAHAAVPGPAPAVSPPSHGRMALPSVHIIGQQDPFKTFSEAIARQFSAGPDRLVLYHNGKHELTSALRSNSVLEGHLRAHLLGQLGVQGDVSIGGHSRIISRAFSKSSRHLNVADLVARSPTARGPASWRASASLPAHPPCPPPDTSPEPPSRQPSRTSAGLVDAGSLSWRPVSACTSIAPVPGQQLVRVRTSDAIQQKPKTIRGVLRASDPGEPCLRDASQPAHVTTYGALLDFISPGGGGDLAPLGILPGEVVAYAVPAGAAGAVAFLAVAAQTVAAPLDAAVKAAEAKSALLQFGVQHVIYFEGFPSAGLHKAVEELEEERNADVEGSDSGKSGGGGSGRGGGAPIRVHTASLRPPTQPGLFDFAVTSKEGDPSGAPVPRLADDVCLLLRTSGTTSTPKGVPLRQGQLVANAVLLGSSFDLGPSDVCLNVMPLFHIGGLSGSILASLAAGGQISCLPAFTSAGMVDALAAEPRPTWYSAVPTIHMLMVKHFDERGGTPAHSLRFIRSGAAALSFPNQQALSATFGVPVLGTYSMSEQMPISQPPAGGALGPAGGVGVPVAASLAIVDPATFMPQPLGVHGAIAISGPTVMTGYLNNPEADARSFFLLSCAGGASAEDDDWFFDTGDLGQLDADGQLVITGRGKELIKRGGEQLSPYEIEEAIVKHEWVRVAVVFSVESELWGEEPGVAIVLSHAAPANVTPGAMMAVVRSLIRAAELAPFKRPVVLLLVEDSDLPRTATHKYIRIGLARALNVPTILDKRGPPHVSPSIVGVRYFLSCFVVFNHVGKTQDDGLAPPSGWRSFANARLFCIHMPCFFLLAGFSLSQTMSRVPASKFRFFLSRFSAMYPMYLISVILLLISFLVTCNPDTYHPTFSRVGLANDTAVAHFCEPPPLMESAGWGGSFAVTLLVTVFGLQAWPFAWPFAWWVSYYAWFSSVYYFCVLCHPWLHGWLMRIRGDKPRLLAAAAGMALLNLAVVLGFWFPFEEGFDERLQPSDGSQSTFDTEWSNWYSLGYYLFPPFWMPIFAGGVVSAFVFDAFRPYAAHARRRSPWAMPFSGAVTDAITVLLLALSVTTVVAPQTLRPAQVDDTDTQGIRTYAAVMSRIYAPLLAVWLYAMASGHGGTAWVFSRPFMVNVLAPTAYNIYVFHQWVGQMYWWVTRNDMWSYWRYRKDYYWFSPQAVPVDWWEYPLLVVLTTAWAMFMNLFNPRLILMWNGAVRWASRWLKVGSSQSGQVSALDIVLKVVTDLTGLDPDPESSVLECGIASFGMPVLLHMLKAEFPGMALTIADLLEAETLRGLSETLTIKLNERAEPRLDNLSPPRPWMTRMGMWRESSQSRV